MAQVLESVPKAQSKWIAVFLGFMAPVLGLLYVGRPRIALALLGLEVCDLALIMWSQPEERFYADALALVLGTSSAVFCFRLAKNQKLPVPRPWFSRPLGLVGITIAVALITFSFLAFLYEPFRMPSESMRPSFNAGTSFWAQKWGYGNYSAFGIRLVHRDISADIQRGDVVVFEYPFDKKENYLKRVVALPGDVVTYQGRRLTINGALITSRHLREYLNPKSGKPLEERAERLGDKEYPILYSLDEPGFYSERRPFPSIESCQYIPDGITCNVPAGSYFVLGDNRDHSSDSRYWGFVPGRDIVGKVTYLMQ